MTAVVYYKPNRYKMFCLKEHFKNVLDYVGSPVANIGYIVESQLLYIR